MRIIPAMDIIDGKCVRLTKGDYNTQKVYSESPVEVAKQFQDNGIEYLHLVDLEGAKSSSIVNLSVLEKIAKETDLKIDFGGGVKTRESIKTALNAGAQQVTLGSVAAKEPEKALIWLKEFGAEKIILGADAKNGKIATNGWLENSNLNSISFIQKFHKQGAKYTVVTDIEKDGVLSGPSFSLYKGILSEVKINLIASGGITSIEDLKRLKRIGCEGAIIGKALYEGRITLKELAKLC